MHESSVGIEESLIGQENCLFKHAFSSIEDGWIGKEGSRLRKILR